MDADAGESLLLNVSDDLEEMDIDISEGENYMDGMMGEIHEQMDRLMKDQRGRGPETAFEMWQAFTSAINWSERWIQALLAFHVTLFVVAVVLRNNENAQMSIFLTVCILVYFCESVNTYCALHWREFSTQNYFDERGVFASVMYAAPLLVIGLLQLVRNLCNAFVFNYLLS